MTNNQPNVAKRMSNSVRLVIALVLAIGALIFWSYTDASQNRDTRRSIERADCARRIGNQQASIRDDLDVAIARGLLVLGTEGFRSPSFEEATTVLELAVVKVEHLEPTQDIVERRCP